MWRTDIPVTRTVEESIRRAQKTLGRPLRYCMVSKEEYAALANEFSGGWLGNLIINGVPIYRFGEVEFR
jgi:hypothetical protein